MTPPHTTSLPLSFVAQSMGIRSDEPEPRNHSGPHSPDIAGVLGIGLTDRTVLHLSFSRPRGLPTSSHHSFAPPGGSATCSHRDASCGSAGTPTPRASFAECVGPPPPCPLTRSVFPPLPRSVFVLSRFSSRGGKGGKGIWTSVEGPCCGGPPPPSPPFKSHTRPAYGRTRLARSARQKRGRP